MSWAATATEDRWSLAEIATEHPTAPLSLDAETAWQLCARRVQPGTALARARVHGDRQLAEAACQIVSIIY